MFYGPFLTKEQKENKRILQLIFVAIGQQLETARESAG
jgi:hypothetical protein